MDWHSVNYTIERLKSDKPFFLGCGLHKPHLPFAVPRKYYDMFPLESIELPPHLEDDLADIPPAGVKMAKPDGDHAKFLKEGRWKAAVQSYLASIAYTDMNVGRLLDALDESPHAITRSSCSGAITAGPWARRATGGNSPCGRNRRVRPDFVAQV